jgi:23S rRNA pseudoU1915 N3-methylase RlmH
MSETIQNTIPYQQGLERDLEAARQSIKERERELASLKLKTNDEDERFLEKLEAKQKEIQAALAKAKASSSQDLGELIQQEAQVDASLSQTKEKMVKTGLDIMRYAKYKVRGSRYVLASRRA